MNASPAELFEGLRAATLALSFAIALVLLLRAPMRRWFGASAAYALWWLLPAALLALLLPPPTVEVAMVAVPVSAAPAAVAAPAMPVRDHSPLWLALWLAGACALAALLWRQQRHFVNSLGRLRALGAGLWRAEGRHGLPAVVGALRPRIVLPDDFETRYGPLERALMIAHERAHLGRRDPLANLGMALLRVLFWFNPMIHAAASRFREDQELSCDQRVIAGTPQSRRAYGDAMLKTLVAAQPVPLGCHWGLAHPLKERLMQLKFQPPRRARRILGMAVAVALSAGGAFAVWSAQTPSVVPIIKGAPTEAASKHGVSAHAGDFRAEISMRIDDGEASAFAIEDKYENTVSFVREEGGNRYQVQARIRDAGERRYGIEATIRRNGELIAQPRLITESGKAAVVRIGQAAPDARFAGIELGITLGPSGVSGLPAPRPLARAVLNSPQLAALSANDANLAAQPGVPGQEFPNQQDSERLAPLPVLPGQTVLGQEDAEALAPLPAVAVQTVPGQQDGEWLMPLPVLPGQAIPGQQDAEGLMPLPMETVQAIPGQTDAEAPMLVPVLPGQAIPGQFPAQPEAEMPVPLLQQPRPGKGMKQQSSKGVVPLNRVPGYPVRGTRSASPLAVQPGVVKRPMSGRIPGQAAMPAVAALAPVPGQQQPRASMPSSGMVPGAAWGAMQAPARAPRASVPKASAPIRPGQMLPGQALAGQPAMPVGAAYPNRQYAVQPLPALGAAPAAQAPQPVRRAMPAQQTPRRHANAPTPPAPPMAPIAPMSPADAELAPLPPSALDDTDLAPPPPPAPPAPPPPPPPPPVRTP